jgi:hypothetical protein
MEICIELQANIPPGYADRQRALSAGEGGFILPHPPGNLAHAVGDLPETPLIVQGLGQDFRFTSEDDTRPLGPAPRAALWGNRIGQCKHNLLQI